MTTAGTPAPRFTASVRSRRTTLHVRQEARLADLVVIHDPDAQDNRRSRTSSRHADRRTIHSRLARGPAPRTERWTAPAMVLHKRGPADLALPVGRRRLRGAALLQSARFAGRLVRSSRVRVAGREAPHRRAESRRHPCPAAVERARWRHAAVGYGSLPCSVGEVTGRRSRGGFSPLSTLAGVRRMESEGRRNTSSSTAFAARRSGSSSSR